ncbi:MAG: class I SAM-dependent methyltransferase, partial [Clostridia bacterium]|nr:class I SAM-dependent methyltransferase [Clostridia bacterium]
LDSGNDPDLVLSEFILSLRLIVRPGLLLADDMDQKDPEVVKGVKLIPYLKDNGYAYRLTHRETPWTNRDILVMDFT